jgi:hypothetical protein
MNCEHINTVLEIVLGVLLIISELLPFCSSKNNGIIHTLTINVTHLYKNIKDRSLSPNKIEIDHKVIEKVKIQTI